MKKRVKIPRRDPKALLDLMTKVRSRHLTDGDSSPLKVLNWDMLNPLIDQALQTEETALRYKRETLNLYQQRALAMVAITSALRSSRDVLTGVYQEQMKMLGHWGFDVLDRKVPSQATDEVA